MLIYSLLEDLPISNMSTKAKNYLRDVLRLMIHLNKKSLEDSENKIKFIFPWNEIFIILDMLKSDLGKVFFDIVNLTIDYLFLNRNLYKSDLANTKTILRSNITILIRVGNNFTPH